VTVQIGFEKHGKSFSFSFSFVRGPIPPSRRKIKRKRKEKDASFNLVAVSLAVGRVVACGGPQRLCETNAGPPLAVTVQIGFEKHGESFSFLFLFRQRSDLNGRRNIKRKRKEKDSEASLARRFARRL
jgi:hypothetical protein